MRKVLSVRQLADLNKNVNRIGAPIISKLWKILIFLLGLTFQKLHLTLLL